MKTVEDYGLRRDLILLDPREQEIYRRIISDLDLERMSGKYKKTDTASILGVQSPRAIIVDETQDEIANQGILQADKNKKRGVVGYESQVGLDIFDYLLSHAREKQGFRFLDLGCGSGYCAEEVAVFSRVKNLPVRVYATDLSYPQGLHPAVISRTIDVLTLDEIGRYDLIVASFVIPYLKDPILGIQNAYNATTVDGLVAATIFPDSISIDGNPAFSESSLFEGMLKKSGGNMQIVELEDNSDTASALHIRRGHECMERNKMHFEFIMPPHGYPVRVQYHSS